MRMEPLLLGTSEIEASVLRLVARGLTEVIA